ncbi:hypothetical protein [Maritimibacter alkaliphilus]|uniref:hypothetical protein n=1 Tax=Maritimibacter alkaliphilus TaxID=404236 RepID=UPI001C97C10C|nr:hypothetical protein [Maritimibacter alkaliphilus]MBY6089340.1 hypothetical protein [Maritimibacter alkaliphilus]
MRKLLSLVLISALAVSACGRNRAPAPAPSGETNDLIPERSAIGLGNLRDYQARYFGTPVETILDAKLERTPTGGILTVTAQSATQGDHDLRLIPETEDATPVDGVLRLTLVAEKLERAPVGTAASRTMRKALFFTNAELVPIRRIEVIGATNSAAISR